MRLIPVLLAASLVLTRPVAAATTAGAAAPEAPATPAGEKLAAWLSAFNGGGKENLESALALFRDRGGRTVEKLESFRGMTGGFELKAIEESTPRRVIALVKERSSDRLARLVLEVEPAPPNLITEFSVEATSGGPPPSPAARLPEAEAIAAARKEVADLAKKDRFTGTVLVAKNGTVLYSDSVGLADIDAKIPNRLDTKFNLGSMNKMFTAVAIAQLAEAGKLRLSDPLSKFLPDYPDAEVGKVTIWQLLTHTGGTGDIFGEEFDAPRADLKEPKDYIALYGRRAPLFPPGSRFEYSNYGFVLLGRVVEKVSGEGYYDYVRAHIYKPAGMTDSDSYLKSEKIPNMAVGYTREDGPGLTRNDASRPMRGSPAGGGYSTAEDLLRFAIALQSHRLLNPEYTDLVTTGKVETAGGGRYAFGFGDFVMDGVRFFGHNGGAPGINAELRIYPVPGYVVVVLCNRDPRGASDLALFIGGSLPAK